MPKQSPGKPAAKSRRKTLPKSKHVAKPDRDFPVVAVGASAGGLEAMEELFRHMPTDTGMAFVVVPHQHPDHVSLLPELLSRTTKMPVVQAQDGTRLEPDRVYTAQPGGWLAVQGGVLYIMEPERNVPPLPIDYFLRTLARDQKQRAICIILSGTGTDGTLGLREIKAANGMVMVQELESAKYSGMPSSAAATELADYVLSPEDMPEKLLAYADGAYRKGAEKPVGTKAALPLEKICLALCDRSGHDFSEYKPSTLIRRIQRRMNVHLIEDGEDYLRYLREYPEELDILFTELLITVTGLFRDPKAFEVLADKALRGLIDNRNPKETLRIWIPGCSTGEEAYSIAILVHECMDKLGKRLPVQIFGTDLEESSIEVARRGFYPASVAVDLPRRRLQRYFTEESDGYRVRKEIRDMLVFAPHNVVSNAPFTRLDLISCRNLLIYLNSPLQKRLLPLFHYALKPDGILFMGTSETVGDLTSLFGEIDKKWKIYRRKPDSHHPHLAVEFPMERSRKRERGEETAPAHHGETRVSNLAENMLMARFVPASAVVNERGDIVYIFGRTGDYLEPAAGHRPRMNIVEMARDDLRTYLGPALRTAASRDEEIIQQNVRVHVNGGHLHVRFTVSRIDEPEPIRGLFLVTLEQEAPSVERTQSEERSDQPGRVEELETELHYTKESLQRTVEELEASNEELRSTNEELQSTNEELQSTNEELETSQEELQSLNEELNTVNAELQAKIEQVSRVNDDLQNLMNSTDIATVFVDEDACVKRYTEKARTLVNLISGDIGRPIGDLVTKVSDHRLMDDLKRVLRTRESIEREVQTEGEHWYRQRVLPYETADGLVDGAVITFTDIDHLKKIEKAIEDSRELFHSIVEAARAPVVVLDKDLQVLFANRAFHHSFNTSAKTCRGKILFEIGRGGWNRPEMHRLLKRIAAGGEAEDMKVAYAPGKKSARKLLVNARRLQRAAGMPEAIILSMEDAIESKKARSPSP